MPSSSPPPDRFQREIDDIIRLAEKRLDRQSPGNRIGRATRGFRRRLGGVRLRLPAPEFLGGWALALLLLSWLLGLFRVGGALVLWIQVVGVALLLAALVLSLTRGRAGSGGPRMWRGEQVSYGSPYGESWLARLRRLWQRR